METNKNFVPYTLALKLKSIGFDEPCLAFYNHKGELVLMDQENESKINTWQNSYVPLGKQYAAPLWQQAWEWFREKHNLHGNMELISSGWLYKTCNLKEYTIDHNVLKGNFTTYEEAQEACLTKLIEIVQENEK